MFCSHIFITKKTINMNTTTRPSFINDFINLGFEKIFNDDFGTPNVLHQTPANITENPTFFKIDLIAPGREKADFEISINKNLLTVAFTKKEEPINEDAKTIRKEFSIQSFKRSFSLNENVDATKIEAAYNSGLLSITIPKKEIEKYVPTTIEIK